MQKCCILLNVLLIYKFGSVTSVHSSTSRLLQAVLGYPTSCVYDNIKHACSFTFTCWLTGGTHVQGCGNNYWLFSCCVKTHNDEYQSFSSNNLAHKSPPSKNNNVLRRRADEDLFQFDCGIPQSSRNVIQKRIIGGREAQFAEYPWQAHIRIAEYQCGGVLVSRRFVATAAHCIQHARLRNIIVYLGELDTQDTGTILEPLPAEKHRVSQKIIHPAFQYRVTQPDRYDIALLRLAKGAGYRSHILPICLPSIGLELAGKTGIIAGWGKTEASSGHTGTNILRTATVPILSTSECLKWHRSKQISVELYGEMFCAGHSDGHQDACLGDSGGPLVVLDRGRFTLAGITSAGFGCGVDHQPGIYHNIKTTANWIEDVVS